MNPYKQASIAALLREAMEGEPESAIWQAIQECTSYHEALRKLLEDLNEQEALENAVAILLDKYSKRKQRIKRGVETRKRVIHEVMNCAGIKSAPLPEATVSIKKQPPKVVVVDETQVPDEYVKVKREIDKRALLDALKQGDVAGAVLSNGGEGLTIKRT